MIITWCWWMLFMSMSLSYDDYSTLHLLVSFIFECVYWFTEGFKDVMFKLYMFLGQNFNYLTKLFTWMSTEFMNPSHSYCTNKFVYTYYFEYTYNYLLMLFILVAMLCIIFISIAYFLANRNLYYEKLSGYECGFDPFADARDPFSVKFYLISIIFMLFDMELLYFFPWVSYISFEFNLGYIIMYLFYLFLMMGFFYEWKKDSLSFV